jgi:hypothetical protein
MRKIKDLIGFIGYFYGKRKFEIYMVFLKWGYFFFKGFLSIKGRELLNI